MAAAASIVGAAGTSALAVLCHVGPVVYGVLGAGGVLAAARLAPWRPFLLAASALFLAGNRPVYRRYSPSADEACLTRAGWTGRITLWMRR